MSAIFSDTEDDLRSLMPAFGLANYGAVGYGGCTAVYAVYVSEQGPTKWPSGDAYNRFHPTSVDAWVASIADKLDPNNANPQPPVMCEDMNGFYPPWDTDFNEYAISQITAYQAKYPNPKNDPNTWDWYSKPEPGILYYRQQGCWAWEYQIGHLLRACRYCDTFNYRATAYTIPPSVE